MRIFLAVAIMLGFVGLYIPTVSANYAERAEVQAMADRLAARGLDRK